MAKEIGLHRPLAVLKLRAMTCPKGGLINRAHLFERGLAQFVASSRWQDLHTLVSSGTGARPRSMPTNRRMESES